MTPGEVVPLRQAQLERRATDLEAWTQEQRKVLKQVYAKDLTDPELDFFENVCTHRNLDPFRGQIIPVKRGGKLSIQVTADGYRALAERKGLYGGLATQFCGPDGVWRDEWIAKEPPTAARTTVIRRDWDIPVRYVARYSSYVQFDHQGNATPIWKKGPDFMLGKCSEVGALKRAFPDDLPGRLLEPQSRMAMEAKAAGYDDDGRHALAYEVSGGRTDSTRELTPGEEYAFRANVAAAQAYADVEAEAEEGIPEDVDPETGVIGSPRPAEDEDRAEREEQDRRRLIVSLYPKIKELTSNDRADFDAFLVDVGLKGIAPNQMDSEQLHTISAYFQGWRPSPPGSALSDPSAFPEADPGPPSQEEAGEQSSSGADDLPCPSWAQQLGEAAPDDYAMDDILAVAEAVTGQRVLQAEAIEEARRPAVVVALRRLDVGDLTLDFTERGIPRLIETEPF
jgi:phage recombination protein Bet